MDASASPFLLAPSQGTPQLQPKANQSKVMPGCKGRHDLVDNMMYNFGRSLSRKYMAMLN